MKFFDLKGVSETLIYPLYLRYRESIRQSGRIQDKIYAEIIQRIDWDFSDLETISEDAQLGIVCRTLIFDNLTKAYIQKYPRGMIISLGSGLDFRFERVDNGKIQWIDIDLPRVIALREKCFPKTDRNSSVSSSILDFSWMASVPAYPPPLFVAEGIFVYFSQEQVKNCLMHISKNYPRSQMILDTYSRYYIQLLKKENPSSLLLKQIYHLIQWGMDGWYELEAAGIQVLDERFQTDIYGDRMPGELSEMMEVFPWIREFSRIGHLRLGVKKLLDDSEKGLGSQEYSTQLFKSLQENFAAKEYIKKLQRRTT